MATRARRICNHIQCNELVVSGSYCAVHIRMHSRDDRPSAARRGYDYRWQRLRKMKLNEQPLCADPFGVHAAQGEVVLATDVHHVDVVSDGNPVLTELSRLQSLCHSCHSRVTAQETNSRRQGDGEGGRRLG